MWRKNDAFGGNRLVELSRLVCALIPVRDKCRHGPPDGTKPYQTGAHRPSNGFGPAGHESILASQGISRRSHRARKMASGLESS
jgi:hypothetical protein